MGPKRKATQDAVDAQQRRLPVPQRPLTAPIGKGKRCMACITCLQYDHVKCVGPEGGIAAQKQRLADHLAARDARRKQRNESSAVPEPLIQLPSKATTMEEVKAFMDQAGMTRSQAIMLHLDAIAIRHALEQTDNVMQDMQFLHKFNPGSAHDLQRYLQLIAHPKGAEITNALAMGPGQRSTVEQAMVAEFQTLTKHVGQLADERIRRFKHQHSALQQQQCELLGIAATLTAQAADASSNATDLYCRNVEAHRAADEMVNIDPDSDDDEGPGDDQVAPKPTGADIVPWIAARAHGQELLSAGNPTRTAEEPTADMEKK